LITRARIAAAVVFLTTCAFRFIGFDFTNDDLLFYAIGRQIAVFGEWPVRDLFEEGDPLHNVASAVLQSLTGHSLVGEAVFDIALLALAAACVTLVAARWLRSATAGALIGVLTVIAWPRLYDYPKALIPALGLWLCDWYQMRPGRRPAMAMGLTIGLAFLLRHDFGIYMAAATVAGIAATGWCRRVRIVTDLVSCAVVAAAVAIPYVLYVQAHVGLAEYIASARRFTQREVSRSDDRPPVFAFDWSRPVVERGSGTPVKVRWSASVDPAARIDAEQRYSLMQGEVDDGRTWKYVLADSTPANVLALVRDPRVEDTANIDRSIARETTPAEPSRLRRVLEFKISILPGVLTRQNAVAWLYHLYRMLPWAGAFAVAVLFWRSDSTPSLAAVPSLVFCLVSAPLLLRGNLNENSRLADFTTPALALLAALVPLAWNLGTSAARASVRVVLVTVGVVTVLAVGSFGLLPRRAASILTLLDEQRWNEESSRLWDGLTRVPPPLDWIPREGGVRGAVEYLRACTAPSDRILVFGFFPDVLYFSGRAAATDRVVLLRGFGTDADEERATLAAMDRHPATIGIVETNAGSGSAAGRVLDGLHPRIERYLTERYARVATTDFGGSTGALFDVWLDKRDVNGDVNGTTNGMWCRSS
jgi:hypothetical protein